MRHTMSHVTHMNESCHRCLESCHTYEWVMSYIWMRHVTHKNESCHTHSCLTHTLMPHTYQIASHIPNCLTHTK